uniref:NADH-ubiquinone oxidoreductase chain 2 n=1 Tax=Bittacus strigosus TaxID=50433 RepID=A0A5C0ANA1_BITST|nr:NADH dehydrogenase subunit 2 [Bittacus strigosus]QEI03712.1 NADH dehydrogenase subunit 2 [Bittacus strigosus]
MFFNLNKYLFMTTLVSGTLITISSNSWLGAWMGLEINLLSFIPLMTNSNNLMSTEASLKYFLTQALASATLLFAILMNAIKTNMISFFPESNYIIHLIVNSALLLKMGAAPFHFWFPGTMEGLTWNNNLILMTWQKIAPLILISYCFQHNFMIFSILISVMIGSLGGLNQTSLRKLMAYSSINHLGWLLAAIISNETSFYFYFCMYTFLSISMIFVFKNYNLIHLKQLFSPSISPLTKFSLFTILLSLGGLPPFLGFLPKWIVIENLVNSNLEFLITTMIFMTLITLFFYTRVTFSAFLLTYTEPKWMFNFSQNNLTIAPLILSASSLFGLILISLSFSIF